MNRIEDKNNGLVLDAPLTITVFTPTWNRAHLLPRAFNSLCNQSVKNFEWIVYDDGSTDETEQLVESWFEIADFPIRYIKARNGGKVAAMNAGSALAVGELFVVLDSDDAAAGNAMERFADVWKKLVRAGQSDKFMGISALKVDLNSSVIGDDYSRLEGRLASYIDRKNLGIGGDKWEVMRTDLMRTHPYPLADGERYMAPSYSWLVLARDYFTVFVNEPLGIIEYQQDGISANNIVHRVGSPRSAYMFYKEFFDDRRFTLRARLNFCVNLNRFALHGGGSIVMHPLEAFFSVPISYIAYVVDKFLIWNK